MTTNQTLTLDNSTLVKDNSEVVSTLKLQEVVVNLSEYNRTKVTIEPNETLHVDF